MPGGDTAIRSKVLPALAALAALAVFAVSANALPAALLRAADDFGVSIGALAQVSAAQFAGFVLAAVVGGVLADLVGKKLVLQAACAALIGGAIVWSLARRSAAAFAGGALMGVGGGILESMSSTLLSDLFPGRRKFFLNLSQTVFCLGAVGGPAVMGLLLPRGVSWRLCFAAISVAGVVLMALFSASAIPRPSHDERIHMAAFREIAGRASFLIPCLALFGYVLTETGVVIYVNAYLRRTYEAPENWAIYALSGFWLAMGVGRWLCAHIPERLSYPKVIAVLLTLTAVTLALQRWQTGWAGSLTWFALSGFAFSGIWPLIVGMSANLNPGYSATVLGITIATGALGCVAGPSFMNALFAWLPPRAVFPAAALPLLISALLVMRLNPGGSRRVGPWRRSRAAARRSTQGRWGRSDKELPG